MAQAHAVHYAFNQQLNNFVEKLLFSQWVIARGLFVTVKKIHSSQRNRIDLKKMFTRPVRFFNKAHAQTFSLIPRGSTQRPTECCINLLPTPVKPLIIEGKITARRLCECAHTHTQSISSQQIASLQLVIFFLWSFSLAPHANLQEEHDPSHMSSVSGWMRCNTLLSWRA